MTTQKPTLFGPIFRRALKLAQASLEVNPNQEVAYQAWCEEMGYDYSRAVNAWRWKTAVDLLKDEEVRRMLGESPE